MSRPVLKSVPKSKPAKSKRPSRLIDQKKVGEVIERQQRQDEHKEALAALEHQRLIESIRQMARDPLGLTEAERETADKFDAADLPWYSQYQESKRWNTTV